MYHSTCINNNQSNQQKEDDCIRSSENRYKETSYAEEQSHSHQVTSSGNLNLNREHAYLCLNNTFKNEENIDTIHNKSISANVKQINNANCSRPISYFCQEMELLRIEAKQNRKGKSNLEYCTSEIKEEITDKNSNTNNYNNQLFARERVKQALEQLQENYVEWYIKEMQHSSESIIAWKLLEIIAKASVFLPKTRENCIPSVSTFGGVTKTRFSHFNKAELNLQVIQHSFLSSFLHDALCVCLRNAASEMITCQQCVFLIEYAVELELKDGLTLRMLSKRLLNNTTCMSFSSIELVEITRLLSLAVKRCEMLPPRLDLLLSRLQSSTFTPHGALIILSSLLRFKMPNIVNSTIALVSRNTAQHVKNAYQISDIVFGLRVVSLCKLCDVNYACAVLEQCTMLLPTVSAHTLGDIAKCVTKLKCPSTPHPLFAPCHKELRRLMPAIALRAEQLFGNFDLRDARLVLRCLTIYQVKHGVVLSKLLSRYDKY